MNGRTMNIIDHDFATQLPKKFRIYGKNDIYVRRKSSSGKLSTGK